MLEMVLFLIPINFIHHYFKDGANGNHLGDSDTPVGKPSLGKVFKI